MTAIASRDAILLALVAGEMARPSDRYSTEELIDRAGKIAARACERWGHVYDEQDERTGWRTCARCGHEMFPPDRCFLSDGCPPHLCPCDRCRPEEAVRGVEPDTQDAEVER